MTRTRILVLCAIDPHAADRRCTGQSRFLGEASLAMGRRGVDVICAEPGAATGYRAVPGTWEEVAVRDVDAVYDRHHDADRRIQRRWERAAVVVGNPVSLSTLCDDKLAFARWARGHDLPVPETVDARDARWRSWPEAFTKPRRGGRGRGVRLVDPAAPPRQGVVQRAVAPRVPGRAARVLLQRHIDGGWFVAGAMDRRDEGGADVVSLATGARACPLDRADLHDLTPAIAALGAALEGLPGAGRAIEIGVDAILARDGPWIIEINARPGRSFDRIGRRDLRRRALLHPFQVLAALAARRRSSGGGRGPVGLG